MGTKNPQPITGRRGGRDGGDAFAFISKGWREASADLSLMRARADRELGHLIESASALAGPGRAAPPPPPFAEELDLVRRRIQPKITELRRQCSSAVLEGWSPKPKAGGASLRVDLSGLTAIRNAIVADGKGGKERAEWDVVTFARSGLKECELVTTIRSWLKELERRSLSNEVFGRFRGRTEFLEKLKLSLKLLNKESPEQKINVKN